MDKFQVTVDLDFDLSEDRLKEAILVFEEKLIKQAVIDKLKETMPHKTISFVNK